MPRPQPTSTISCRLCGKAPAIDSHIIPKAFNLGDTTTCMIPVHPGSHPRRAPIGVYSPILCAVCDGTWGRLDEYAAKVLMRGESHDIPCEFVRGNILPVLRYDYLRLHTFFITMVWRALHSSHIYFERIQIPTLRASIEKIVSTGDQALADQHRILFSYCPEVRYRGTFQPIPRRCAMYGCTFDAIIFVLNNLHVTITYGPVPEFLPEEILRPAGMTVVPAIPFMTSFIAQGFEGMRKHYPDAFGRRKRPPSTG